MNGSSSPRSPKQRVRAFLSHPRLPVFLALGAVVLCSPALGLGFLLDDLVHRVVLQGEGGVLGFAMKPSDLFRFVDGNPEHCRQLIHAGALPWFANPSIKLAFFRPLSSALHRVDYALFPSSAVLMHLHSLAWFAALVVLVTKLHRRFGGPAWVVGLGAAFFAFDDAHGVPAAWIANRNALVALTFGVGALLAYDLGRRDRSRFAALAGPWLWACALLSGESAIAMGGYFLAHAAFIDPASRRSRALALAPYGLVLLAFVATYRALGYGASGSALYVDPTASPGRFVVVLLERLPALAAAQLGPLTSDPTAMIRSTEGRLAWLVAALLVSVPIVAWLWPVLRRDRVAAFFGTGALLALVPVSATFPNDRLLLACGVGASAVMARGIAWSRGEPFVSGAPAPSRVAALLGGALLVWHGVFAPLQLPLKTLELVLMNRLVEASRYPDGLAGKEVVMVAAPTIYGCTYTPMIEYQRRGHRLVGAICLADSNEYVDVTREAENVLLLRPAGGFARPMMDDLYRDEQQRFRVGDEVALRGCVIEVREVDAAGRAMTARARFEGPMEAPTRVFTAWTARGIERFPLPAIGETVRVEGVSMERLMTRR